MLYVSTWPMAAEANVSSPQRRSSKGWIQSLYKVPERPRGNLAPGLIEGFVKEVHLISVTRRISGAKCKASTTCGIGGRTTGGGKFLLREASKVNGIAGPFIWDSRRNGRRHGLQDDDRATLSGAAGARVAKIPFLAT